MKNIIFVTITIMLLFTTSCTNDSDDTPQIEELTQQEKDDLLFIREEEKLARDVYLYAYGLYGERTFNNIANSEQTHMDKVLTLINTYNLSDPASSERGVFLNQELQGLYNDLTTQVDISLVDAFKVGATIEDLDIRDIEEFEDRTDKTDIIAAYDLLRCGSRNHMRSYNNQLSLLGITYIPQFIPQDEFEEIINSQNERCGQ